MRVRRPHRKAAPNASLGEVAPNDSVAIVLADLHCRAGFANCVNIVINAALVAAALDLPLGMVAGRNASALWSLRLPVLALPPSDSLVLDFTPGRASRRSFQTLQCTNLSAVRRPILIRHAAAWVAPLIGRSEMLPSAVRARAERLFRPGTNAVGAVLNMLWGPQRLPRPQASASEAPGLPFSLALHARHQYSYTQATWKRQPWSRDWLRDRFHDQLIACARAALATWPQAQAAGRTCNIYVASETRELLDAFMARSRAQLPHCRHWTHRDVSPGPGVRNAGASASDGQHGSSSSQRGPPDNGQAAVSARAPDHGDLPTQLAVDISTFLLAPLIVGTLDSSLSELLGAAAKDANVLLAPYPPGAYRGVREGEGVGPAANASHCVHANMRWPYPSRELPPQAEVNCSAG